MKNDGNTSSGGAGRMTELTEEQLALVAAAGSKPGGDTGDPPEIPKPKPKML